MGNVENFKISAALKDIIGKELITDEFVAVFELVKNSFDANASKVEVIFENNYEKEKAKIIIKDNGKGMDYEDLRDKWLFVAYSAKKLGRENTDYRDKIKSQRVFAGAKGVGRFSCDRLGRFLNLITIKDKPNHKIENLVVNWEDFENVDDKEFVNIKVIHSTLKENKYNLKNGTVLEISGLRDIWDRERILKLKISLAKLINPNQGNDSANFDIEIIAEDERGLDKEPNSKGEKRNNLEVVNGKVKNSIFETLDIKTSNILVHINSDGSLIETTLRDRGDLIYFLKEKNPYRDLKNISIYLFQLNRTAKFNFTKTMGMEPVKYGSVFMYKNGFRVYPYGEEGDDLLQINRRKQQGYNRFLGTRDVIGRIEINGEQSDLREISSRDGGLVKTPTYFNLLEFFYDYVLKRLENYVVNIIQWGDERLNKETGEVRAELWAKDVKVQILELISGFINSKDIVDIQYEKNFLEIIESKQSKSVEKIVKNISKVAAKSDNPELVKEAKKIEKAVKEIKADAQIANVKATKEENLRKVKEVELETEKLKTEFYKKQLAPDSDALIHHIKNNNISIKTTVENILQDIKSPQYDENDLLKDLSFILFHCDKAIKAANIITHVDLSESDAQNVELSGFLQGYIDNYQEITSTKRTKIRYEHEGKGFRMMISKIELAIIIDNLEDNSYKWGAKNIYIKTITNNPRSMTLIYSDDGKGLSDKYLSDPSQILRFKETDSKNGTGLGLYVVHQVLDRMGASIEFIGNNIYQKGANFKIEFIR